ncbi:ABC transporter ATP-binding protein [Gammaproteobacteria bacterium]|nr:ABC transporter ATP-binding protein [Gammaproteobacteria bacterium]
MIKLVDILKTHRTDDLETTPLNNINLEVADGEFLAVMGPSGCGKSTLLNIIGLMDTPTSGLYYFNELELAGFNEKQRAEVRKNNIGVIFQSFNLIDELTVYQNVDLALLYQKVSPEERKVKVTEVLKQVGIDHRQKHFPQQLSGGQQQRVAIARAIVGQPKLLLADEPTGNLDTKNGNEVMAELKRLNDQGTTIIMVTHSDDHAKYGSRIVNMLDGEILPDTTSAKAA